MSEIVVLGSINMDLVVRAERMPRPGETLRGEQFVTVPGGKGANQAAAAARQGASVAMIGRVGADSFGPVLLDNLRAQGVDVAHVRRGPRGGQRHRHDHPGRRRRELDRRGPRRQQPRGRWPMWPRPAI